MTSTASDDDVPARAATDARVALKPFRPAHLALLAAWLRRPHVAPWFPEPEANLAWATSPPVGGSQAIITWGTEEVGYVRWQRVGRAALDALGLHEIPANSVDIDILLGPEETAGRGVGPSALAVLAERIREDAGVPLAGLTTSIENTRAHRAFAKAGFHIARPYEPAGLGPCHLMLRDLRSERGKTPRG
jgi:aminoglycoside 6'-N-acetyltransferase